MTRALPALLLAATVLPGELAGQAPDSVRRHAPPPQTAQQDTDRGHAARQDTAAQDTARQDTVPQDTVPRPPRPVEPPVVQDSVAPTTPGGAFIRSLILPGWGQAEYDAYFRGSIYYAGWIGNWFMNFRNFTRLASVRDRLGLRTGQIEAALITNSPNPDSMRAQIDSFPSIVDTAVREDSVGNALRLLVDSRVQQREDWIAWSIFWLLASGVDAYVTAHLADFPAEVELRPNRDGSLTLQLGVPWPPRPPHPRPPDGGR